MWEGKSDWERARDSMTFCTCGSLALLPLNSGKGPAHRVSFQALRSKFALVFFYPQWPLVAKVIEVKFEKLDLEPDTYCRYDYVALFNGGETDNSRRIGKFCGDRAPG